ncbi:MAG: hypothetical protein JW818_14100 [Pirellulales bacterium]|nr:hypothetical protein [Pirellulales bacterium]
MVGVAGGTPEFGLVRQDNRPPDGRLWGRTLLMEMLFLICAAVGSTVLVFQVVMTLIGLGGEAFHIDVPGGLDGHAGFDTGHAGFDTHGGFDTHDGFDSHDVGAADHHTDSSWMFSIISFRTVVAALAFFGLAGLATQSSGAGNPISLGVGVAAGAAAMVAVYWMMRALHSLRADGTARIERAIGQHGTVYVTVPAEESGAGKIQLNLQGRTVEYQALTTGHLLKPGTKVVICDVITSDTVAVEPVLEDDD